MITRNSTERLGEPGLDAGIKRALEQLQRLPRKSGGARSRDMLGDRTATHTMPEREARARTARGVDVARAAPTSAVRFGDFRFDPADGSLRRGEEWVHLAPTPSKLLALLIARAGRLVDPIGVLEQRVGDESGTPI